MTVYVPALSLAASLAALWPGDVCALEAQCDLSCPIGQRCDADGVCVASNEEAMAPFHESPQGGFAGEAEPTAYRHDGLLLRLSLGLGPSYLSEELTSPALTVDLEPATAVSRIDFVGLVVVAALDVGLALSDAFSLHLRLAELSLPDPGVEQSGNAQERLGSTDRSAPWLAPAVTYFIMPQNVYLTLAAGPLLWRGATFDGDKSPGDLGLCGSLDVGIEWWVGKQWGLGVGARLLALWAGGEAQPLGDRATRGLSPLLVLSMTYQ